MRSPEPTEPPAAPPRPRGQRLLGVALRVGVAVVLFLALGELAARLTGFVDRVNPFPRQLYRATSVPDLPYQLQPGIALDVHGSHVEVNRLGLRDRPDVAPTPAPGVQRILVIGDSVAFGWLQDAARAFPHLLEVDLNANPATPGGAPEPPAGRGRFEVLNGGVPGYNAVSEAAFFREIGIGLAPRTVVVAVNLNDFDATPHLNALGILSTTDDRVSTWSPANWSELYLAIRWAALATRGDSRVKLGGAEEPAHQPTPQPSAKWDNFDRYVSRLRKQFYHAPSEPQWSEMRAAWVDLKKRAREHGIRLVFALFPDGDQLDTAAPDLAPQQRLLELCTEEHLECIDLYPAFAAAPAGTPLFADIMHPNDAGHAIAARVVAERLRAPAGGASASTQ